MTGGISKQKVSRLKLGAHALIALSLALLLAAAVQSDVLTPVPVPPPEFPNVWAVLIGIDDYIDDALPDLSYAGRDARAMLGALTNAYGANADSVGDNARAADGGMPYFDRKNALLLAQEGDGSATSANLRYALQTWLPAHAGRDDLVFIYLSGHGIPVPDDSRPDGIRRYFITMDTRSAEIAESAVGFDEIARLISYLPSEHVLTIVDSCFSGLQVGKSLGGVQSQGEEFWQRQASVTGKIVLTASAHDQQSVELSEIESGLFTYYIVEGLNGFADANRDGILSAGELFYYARDRVRVHAARLGVVQVPQAAAVTMLIRDYALLTTHAYEAKYAEVEERDEAVEAGAGGAILVPGAADDLPLLEDALGKSRLIIEAPAERSFARIVTADGLDLGANPLPLSLELPPGEYAITIGAQGRLSVDTSAMLETGRVFVLPTVYLLPDPSFVQVLPDDEFEGARDIIKLFLEKEKEKAENDAEDD